MKEDNKTRGHLGKELNTKPQMSVDIGRETARTAGTAWATGYMAAVMTITAKVRTMCNQRQIMEYLESIKL